MAFGKYARLGYGDGGSKDTQKVDIPPIAESSIF